MIINYKQSTIQIKVVYYGCAMSGKTTTLRKLFENFPKEKKRITSIETTTGRTLFFDFGVLTIKGGEWRIKVSLYSATGQDFYASTRPSTLAGTDGIIFIVDSQNKYLNDNLKSWLELKRYYGQAIKKIPIVFCLNKQDLSNLFSINDLIEEFKIEKNNRNEIIKTTAIDGKGIILGFKMILKKIFPAIHIR